MNVTTKYIFRKLKLIFTATYSIKMSNLIKEVGIFRCSINGHYDRIHDLLTTTMSDSQFS